ncbi:MAG: Asp-tRNA(Asn)/Glu-tRNA(Gln) amidotransferase subunit GatC [Candidatus Komeilibacteria bacterium]|nr:Asp-tRNA(Asn)/Glu-tRNA(Gln) amidotransferase subunit GatC [Candidatus Komeilibacteria bacterium]
MSLKLTEIEHLAKLARLELSQTEQEKFPQEISGILDYVSRLQEVKGYELDKGLKTPRSLLRVDEAATWSTIESQDLINQAPETENGLIKTKPVFER